MLLSAAPGLRSSRTGAASTTSAAGSHGSLHASDSLGALLFSGLTTPAAHANGRPWSIADVAPMALAHFGVT